MEAEIRPEPTLEEREVILVALEHELLREPDPRGEWWRAGLRESLSAAPAEPAGPGEL